MAEKNELKLFILAIFCYILSTTMCGVRTFIDAFLFIEPFLKKVEAKKWFAFAGLNAAVSFIYFEHFFAASSCRVHFIIISTYHQCVA